MKAGPRPRRRGLAALATGLLLTMAGCQSAAPGPHSGSASGTAGASRSPSATVTSPADLVRAENAKAGTSSWWVEESLLASASQLSGYTDRSSARPGQPVELKLHSTLGPVTVTAVRIGSYGGVGGRQVWASQPVEASAQPAPVVGEGRMVTAGWHTSLTLPTTDWPDGSYLLVLRAGGQGAYIPLTLRPASLKGRLVLVNPTATWQAYNAFGGFSLYKGTGGQKHATRVSFDRPYDDNAQHFRLDEYPYVVLGEERGLPMAYVTSEDLDGTPGLLDGALGVVSGGHDEYWSVPMRAAVTAARDQGTNVAFLGGNELYWRVRFEDEHRTVVGFRDLAGQDPVTGPTRTVLWRAGTDPDPENSLTGQLYECYPVHGDWVVTTPDWFGYRGTQVTKGTAITEAIGVESNRAYPVPGTPDTLQVVAAGPVSCGNNGRSMHTATYYTSPSGSGVVAVGTINWANLVGASAGDSTSQAFARTVTGNVLEAMAAGPLGKAHPSVPNLAQLDLSPSTAQGTAGPATFPSR